MKLLFIFVYLFFCLSIQLEAQSDFRSGYYISNQGDTVYGLLDYRSDVLNSVKCIFKKDITSEKFEFLPGEIKSYRFNDSKFYVSRKLPKDIDGKNKQVFLEWLIKGKASILLFESTLNIRYFIAMDNDSLYELHNTKHMYNTKNGKTYEMERKEYVGELRYYLRDCPSISQNIDYTYLDNNSLVRLAKTYHQKVCNNEECIVYERKEIRLIFSVAPSLSYLYSKPNIYWGRLKFIIPIRNSGYGIKLNISNLPLVSQNLSIQLECSFYKNNHTVIPIGIQYPYNTYFLNNKQLFQFKIIKFPLSVKYTFPFHYISPFISLGFSFSTIKVNITNISSSPLVSLPDVFSSNQYSINSNIGFNMMLINRLKFQISGIIERGFTIPGYISYNNNSFIFESSLFYTL